VAAHLWFHLLKLGVTEDSSLELICASFAPQGLCDAINTNMKYRKLISAVQAELDDDM
jgi:hypothetical protein